MPTRPKQSIKHSKRGDLLKATPPSSPPDYPPLPIEERFVHIYTDGSGSKGKCTSTAPAGWGYVAVVSAVVTHEAYGPVTTQPSAAHFLGATVGSFVALRSGPLGARVNSSCKLKRHQAVRHKQPAPLEYSLACAHADSEDKNSEAPQQSSNLQDHDDRSVHVSSDLQWRQ